MVFLSTDEAIDIDFDTFIEKYGINGLSGFSCNIYCGDHIELSNILSVNPSFIKKLMERGWDPTRCMLKDGDHLYFDTWNTRFDLYKSIYLASSFPRENKLFIRYFSCDTDHQDISDDSEPIRIHCKKREEYKFYDLVERFKNDNVFEFLKDPKDPKFSHGVWMNLNPTKLNASIKIQSWTRMIMCIKKVQLMRCVPDALFDKEFGNMRRSIMEVEESNWSGIK